jgi:nanoRNase/pAp phosphatase (c-di-AMP/oligoRNAs hydrolase)
MLADFGGGGHRGVGSCHIPRYKADKHILKILNILLKNEN